MKLFGGRKADALKGLLRAEIGFEAGVVSKQKILGHESTQQGLPKAVYR